MLGRIASLVAGASRSAGSLKAARAFSAAAAPAGEVKLPDAPLSLTGTPAQIGTLVWQLAMKENQLEKVQDELHQVSAAFYEHPELVKVAVDPFIPIATKVNIINTVFKDSGATEIVKRLFASLAEQNALAATLQLTEAYDKLQLAHKKEVHCTIVTAEPLDKLEKDELTKQAGAFVEPGFKLISKEKVDKKLLGGFILEFEDRLVDMSVAKKLEEFNNLVFKLESDLHA